jgi:hypothetical protein
MIFKEVRALKAALNLQLKILNEIEDIRGGWKVWSKEFFWSMKMEFPQEEKDLNQAYKMIVKVLMKAEILPEFVDEDQGLDPKQREIESIERWVDQIRHTLRNFKIVEVGPGLSARLVPKIVRKRK